MEESQQDLFEIENQWNNFQQLYKKDRGIEDYQTLWAAVNTILLSLKQKTILGLREVKPPDIAYLLKIDPKDINGRFAVLMIYRMLQIILGCIDGDEKSMKIMGELKRQYETQYVLFDYTPQQSRNKKRNILIFLLYTMQKETIAEIAEKFNLTPKQASNIKEEVAEYLARTFGKNFTHYKKSEVASEIHRKKIVYWPSEWIENKAVGFQKSDDETDDEFQTDKIYPSAIEDLVEESTHNMIDDEIRKILPRIIKKHPIIDDDPWSIIIRKYPQLLHKPHPKSTKN